MGIKKFFLILITLLSCNTTHSYDYPYECVYESTPEELKDLFYSNLPGGRILYGGTDRHGRYLVEKRPPGQPRELYAFYRDEKGDLWQSLINQQTKTETPFIYIKEPDSDDCEGFHPDELKTMHLIPKDHILYPPQNMPRLNDDDYTMIDLLFESGQKATSDFEQVTHSPQKNYNHENDYNNALEKQSILVEGDSWWHYALLGGGVFGLWALGLYYILSNTATGSRYLRRYDLWSMWRSEDPYEVLLLLEPKKIADNLIQDINIRYCDETNAIQRFLDDIRQEYDILLQWLQFRKQLANLYISLGEAFDMIENRLLLLDHMRKAVYYWRAQELSDN